MSASITIESLNTVLQQTNSIREVLLTFVEEKFIDPFKKELSKYSTEYITGRIRNNLLTNDFVLHIILKINFLVRTILNVVVFILLLKTYSRTF